MPLRVAEVEVMFVAEPVVAVWLAEEEELLDELELELEFDDGVNLTFTVLFFVIFT